MARTIVPCSRQPASARSTNGPVTDSGAATLVGSSPGKALTRSAVPTMPIDPMTAIDKPILIVGGGHDVQVARVDFLALSAAATLAKTLWLPNMNHVLVDVTDDNDNLAAYNQPERALDADLVEAVATLIKTDETR